MTIKKAGKGLGSDELIFTIVKGMISMYESLFPSTRWFSQISSGFFEDQQLPKSSASCPIPSNKRRSLNFDRLRMKL